jgi:hypothetical protein
MVRRGRHLRIEVSGDFRDAERCLKPVVYEGRQGVHPGGDARTVGGKTSRETAYLTASLPAADAQLADLQDWAHRRLS